MSISSSTANRIRKLASIPAALRQGQRFQVTRLTVLKTLFQNPEDAQAFVFQLAQWAAEQLDGEHGHRPSKGERDKFGEPVAQALAAIKKHRRAPDESLEDLYDCMQELSSLQNQYREVPYGVVRSIESMPALIVENAVRCMLHPEEGADLAYVTARDYCERYDPSFGTGLIPASAPRVQEIADFLAKYSFHPLASASASASAKPLRKRRRSRSARSSTASSQATAFSEAYPAIATWVQNGWVEIGSSDGTGVCVRALGVGGQVWAGKTEYSSLEAALADLDAGISDWMAQNTPTVTDPSK